MYNCKFGLLIKFHRNAFRIFAIYLTLLSLRAADGRPQDFFESVAMGAVQMAGQAAEIMANGGALKNDNGFEVPFAKVHSKQEAGFGEAIRKHDNSDSSSEEDRRRRKRSLGLSNEMALESLYEMEALMPLPHQHRSKRAPCFSWGGMGSGGGGTTGGGGAGNGTGGGAGGGGDGIDDDVFDVERRRRQMAARRRKAAQQRKKSRTTGKKTTTRKTNKKGFMGEEGDEPVVSTASRRKRQTEIEDLSNNMTKSGKDISQHAQQFAETIRGAWENFANSMNQFAQKVKQAFAGNSGGMGGSDGGGGETGEI